MGSYGKPRENIERIWKTYGKTMGTYGKNHLETEVSRGKRHRTKWVITFYSNSWDFTVMNRNLTDKKDQIWEYLWELHTFWFSFGKRTIYR